MLANPPYLSTPGTLTTALGKIKAASKPPRFTNDFVETKLQIKGGAGRSLAPFLKKIGFLNSDGTPTRIYDRFRNPATSGAAVAEALRAGYKSLYEVNEYAHALPDKDLKGLIVQVTGLEENDTVVQCIFGTFKRLKDAADFEAKPNLEQKEEHETKKRRDETGLGFNLAYTINLNLPATTNVEVFNAIFRSLREHLLDEK